MTRRGRAKGKVVLWLALTIFILITLTFYISTTNNTDETTNQTPALSINNNNNNNINNNYNNKNNNSNNKLSNQKYEAKKYWDRLLRFHRLKVSSFPSHWEECNPQQIQNVVVVSGVPKSGTTITGRILSIPDSSMDLSEPATLDSGFIKRCRAIPFQLGEFIMVRNLFPEQFVNITSIDDDNEQWLLQVKDYFDFFFRCSYYQTIVMKEAIALYSLDWLFSTYNPVQFDSLLHLQLDNQFVNILSPLSIPCNYPMKMLIIIRHPASIIASWINLKWGDFTVLIDHYISHQSKIQSYWEKYHKNPYWIFSRHEDFLRDPVQRSHDWSFLLDYPSAVIDDNFDNEILNFTSSLKNDPSNYGNGYSNALQLNRWKSLLTPEQIQLIYEKSSHLWSTFYDDSDW